MVWFGIFIVLVVEKAQITPPIGFNLFVLQGMTGHNIFRIAAWSFPMYLIMLAMVFVMIAVPELATWLPKQMIPVLPMPGIPAS
jgi:TRAP-type C4-dicarboxylate transport system permease large subunit